jgi:hypothetical protein
LLVWWLYGIWLAVGRRPLWRFTVAVDLTITWKDAVPVESVFGQSSVGGRMIVADAAAMAAGFDIRPFHDQSIESAMKGAIPFSTDEDFSWADEYQASVEEVVRPRGRPRKEQ